MTFYSIFKKLDGASTNIKPINFPGGIYDFPKKLAESICTVLNTEANDIVDKYYIKASSSNNIQKDITKHIF